MAWYHIPGNRQDAVICTQVRLSRNLADYPFPGRLEAPLAREIIAKAGEVLLPNGFTKIDFTDISRTAAQALVEQQYASPAFLRESLPHALFVNEPCNLAVAICEEDHVRIRSLRAGLSLQDAFLGACTMEELMDAALGFAFDKRLGYLTSSPACAGTAMQASVTLSLPLLAEERRLASMASQILQVGLTLRGLSGVESSFSGGLCRLSNRVIPGLTEEEMLARLEHAVDHLVAAEATLRGGLSAGDGARIRDRARRAEGILRYAHMLPPGELLEYLADLRLGAALGITDLRVEALTALFVEAMPATLTLAAKEPPKQEQERDILRAQTVRATLFGA